MNESIALEGAPGISASASRSASRVDLPFEFRGNGGEYFRIWIVNLLLTIVTLGIYSAWAKVRRLRYFYGNTYLDGHPFEFQAGRWPSSRAGSSCSPRTWCSCSRRSSIR